jgi:hypothetical protein
MFLLVEQEAFIGNLSGAFLKKGRSGHVYRYGNFGNSLKILFQCAARDFFTYKSAQGLDNILAYFGNPQTTL